MKAYIRPLLLITFPAILLILFFYFVNVYINIQYSKVNKQTLGIESQQEKQSLPLRLIIPAINVNAAVQQVGVTPEGIMEVPNNITDVGWFKLGSPPGEKGSAVISGHFDGKNGEAGVFLNLYKLKKGDKLYVRDDKGTTTVFEVRESRTYTPGYAEEVFGSNDKAHLNLITCDGVWDGAKKSYTKRLVVFSDVVR